MSILFFVHFGILFTSDLEIQKKERMATSDLISLHGVFRTKLTP